MVALIAVGIGLAVASVIAGSMATRRERPARWQIVVIATAAVAAVLVVAARPDKRASVHPDGARVYCYGDV